MRWQRLFTLVIVGSLVAAGASRTSQASQNEGRGSGDSDLVARTERAASSLRATPDELKWKRIPWLTNLTEGVSVAKQENRPILLWMTGQGPPLDRC